MEEGGLHLMISKLNNNSKIRISLPTIRELSAHAVNLFKSKWCIRMLAEKLLSPEDIRNMPHDLTVFILNQENAYIALKEKLISIPELLKYNEDADGEYNVTRLVDVFTDYGIKAKRLGCYDPRLAIIARSLPESDWGLSDSPAPS